MRVYSIVLLMTLFCFSCKSVDNLSSEEGVSLINDKVESKNYIFVPQTAIPTSGRSVSLNYSYSLKVSKDSVSSYLPYFGRAYSAPMSSDDSGIKFISTDFDYKISEKKKGVWDVSIVTKDTKRKYNLTLKVGGAGYTTLTVLENDRQPITFYGKIE